MTSKTAINVTKNDCTQELLLVETTEGIKEFSDNELAVLVRQSRPEFFSQIYDRYQRKLFAYFSRVERNREEAENLVQDVFVKVLQNLTSYDAHRRFDTWIFSIAHNVAINHVKHASLKKFVSLESMTACENKLEFPSLEENSDAICIRKEVNEEVDDAVKKLPSQYRQVLILRYYYDKSYKEIGKIIGKSINTVGTLIRRAKNKMMVHIYKANGQMAAMEVRHS